MNKTDLVSYLVGLHNLIDAQTKGSRSIATPELGAEYEKHWDLLKETIRKENENEARKRETHDRRKDGADLPRSFPEGSREDRPTRADSAAVHGEGSSGSKG